MIPLNPVETIAPINDRNFVHFSSLIILYSMSTPSATFLASNPPACASSLNMWSVSELFVISTSLTGRPGVIMIF